MNETDINETDTGDVIHAATDDAPLQSEPKPRRNGIGFGTALMLSLLAGAGGAFGGWALGQYVMPQFIAPPTSAASEAAAKRAKPVDLTPLRARLTAAEKKLTQQAAGLSRLTSQMNAKPTTISVGSPASSSTGLDLEKSADLAPLLKRLAALEAKTKASRTPIKVDGEPLPAAAYLDGVETRLVTLEKSLFELGQMSVTPEDDSGFDNDAAPVQAAPDYSAEIEALRLRLDEVERDMSAGLAETKALAAAPRVVKDPVLLPPFPRQAMLELMTASKSADGDGWFGKTVKKHISVRDPQEVARANEVLDAIEAASARADYRAALAQIQALPSQVRSAASSWSAAVEREVNSSQSGGQNALKIQELGE